MTVSTRLEADIAFVTVDNPPVNALSQAVRRGLLDALDATDGNRDLRAVILTCSGRTFIAGADIKEFGQPPRAPHLPDVVQAIARSRHPWIAAIHGTALGGGLEIALACRYRLARVAAQLGFPEVSIGTVPGAGGSVMLPRLTSPLFALRMIAGGKPVSAAAAHAAGLLDAITETDLLGAAKDLARTLPADSPRPTVFDLPPPSMTEPDAFEQTARRTVKRARGQISPKEAVDLVRDACTLPVSQALARERVTFLRLRDHPQARALRHIFFAERATAKPPRLRGVAPRDIARIGIVGGGTMGAGIAAACLQSGLGVTMIERDSTALTAGMDRVHAILDSAQRADRLQDDAHAACRAAFGGDTDYGALGRADLVIEAVFEDMRVKQEVFSRLDAATRPDTVLATNTSYLDVNVIARTVQDPSRVLGLHFFSPAHIMKLLEIVVPDAVADEVLATGVALARTLRKIPVLAGVCDGFIANRIMSAYRRDCEYMLEDGALPWQIDAAMTDYGLPMGVFQMQDMAGLDISWAMRKRQAATRDPAQRYVEIADRLCEMGRLGRKTGRGWYIHDDGQSRPDPEVEALILSESQRKGITRRTFTPDDIMRRILGTMQSEGTRLLAEGIADSADDIDVVMVNAYGFPRWTGGPMYQAALSGGG